MLSLKFCTPHTNESLNVQITGNHLLKTILVPFSFLDTEGGSQKATLVVLLVVISSPKAFLIRSAAQRNFAYTFVLTFPTDLLSQNFMLVSN